MKDKFLAILLISIVLSSCSQINEDINEAKLFLNKHEYQNAIDLLSRHKSKKARIILSDAYLDFGISILRNEEIDREERYPQAKEKFKTAYEINPKNNTARDLYTMIDKLELTK